MSIRDWKLRVEDILEAVTRIEQYAGGLSYVQWQHDQKTIDAVIRNFEIIGEAATHVPSRSAETLPRNTLGENERDS